MASFSLQRKRGGPITKHVHLYLGSPLEAEEVEDCGKDYRSKHLSLCLADMSSYHITHLSAFDSACLYHVRSEWNA
jgi:hypothetical protein